MSLNVVFAGTSLFSVPILQALIESKHQLVAVYTKPDRPVGRGQKIAESPIKGLAKSQEITICQPLLLQGEEEQKMRALKADVMLIAAYGLLLPRSVLAAYRFGCINVHASLLPRWRGAAPIQHAILAGDQEAGVTIMKMDEGLDTGDILIQKSCPIGEKDTTGDLYKRLSVLGSDLLIETLDRIESGETVQAIKQDASRVTYAPKIQKEDAKLKWHKFAIDLVRQIRAFNPIPIAFTYFKYQPLRIWQAEVLPEKTQSRPGSIIRSDKNGLDVAASNGVLRLHQLQLPGKRVQLAQEFINAHRKELNPGQTVFG